MSLPWFRLYTEVLYDPKVQRLRPTLFKFWVNMLCLAADQKERGILPDLPHVAFALRCRLDRAKRWLDELEAAGLLDRDAAGRLSPHNWNQRQYVYTAATATAARRKHSYVNYEEYLLSPWWRERRIRAIELAGFRCQVCNSPGPLNVHHREYERLGCEQDQDLLTLCRPCHELFHRNGKLVKRRDGVLAAGSSEGGEP